jgi:LCP family protein required for cell wall assembly
LGLRNIARMKVGPVAVSHVVYGVACVGAAAVIGTAGYASSIVSSIHSLGDGASLGNEQSVGEMNILVMGLESRTEFNGTDLDINQLNETHSGNEASVTEGLEGSQDTDTLILIHIPAGGKKAVGFSIPRDDVVNYPESFQVPTGSTTTIVTEGKIDAAYADGYNQEAGVIANSATGSAMSTAEKASAENQAGQLAEVETVESVTGVHVDHFIVSNIIGFYELAQQFGGMEVCIQPAPASQEAGLGAGANLTDYDSQENSDNSGFDALDDGYNTKTGGDQYLHLDAAQALAYVRSRDTLPGVDVGRTKRQQAAIQYYLWKLETGGILDSLSDITTMLNDAQGYIEYDSSWNLLDFASDIGSLSSAALNFATLPEASVNNVYVPSMGSDQSVDLVDPPALQAQVNEAFYGTPLVPKTAKDETVTVYNGGSTAGIAGDISTNLGDLGYRMGTPADASSQSEAVTASSQVYYGGGPDDEANAAVIANLMGVQQPVAESSLKAGQVSVVTGSSVNEVPPGLLITGWDYIDPADWVTDAQGNDQSVPGNITNAATAEAGGGSYEGSSSSQDTGGSSSGSGDAVTAVPDTAAAIAVAGTTSGRAVTVSSRASSTAVDQAVVGATATLDASSSTTTTSSSTVKLGQYGISGCPY